MPVSQAKVKQVLSGDTLVLASLNNAAQERTLSLAFVSAPRMRREGDEVRYWKYLSDTPNNVIENLILHIAPLYR